MAKSLVELYGTTQRNQQNTQVVKNETEKPNFFTRSLHTIGDIAANILTGAAKGLEGIYDFGASVVGAVPSHGRASEESRCELYQIQGLLEG